MKNDDHMLRIQKSFNTVRAQIEQIDTLMKYIFCYLCLPYSLKDSDLSIDQCCDVVEDIKTRYLDYRNDLTIVVDYLLSVYSILENNFQDNFIPQTKSYPDNIPIIRIIKEFVNIVEANQHAAIEAGQCALNILNEISISSNSCGVLNSINQHDPHISSQTSQIPYGNEEYNILIHVPRNLCNLPVNRQSANVCSHNI